MGSVLPLVGIAALAVLGLVVLLTALTYDRPVKVDKSPDRATAREHRRQRNEWRTKAHHSMPAWRSAVSEWAVTSRTRTTALAEEWRPRLSHYARYARTRWLTLESTTGQLIAAAAASVLSACLLVMLG
jgi:ABC-type anion transport system duplicated permease subunit